MPSQLTPPIGTGNGCVFERLEDRRLLSGDPVLQWNAILLDAVRAQRTPPPYAARNMAIVHVAIFDAVNAVDGRYDPYLAKRSGPKGASIDAAAAQAAHDTLAALYPARKPTFDAALSDSLGRIPDGNSENAGRALGRSVAHRVLAKRHHDGADEVVPYTPGTGPSDWVPTPPSFAPALLPNWPHVSPFALRRGDQFRPAGPPDLASADFAQSLNQVKELGSRDSVSRTPEQTQIALFWADGAGTATPPGHWNQIAAQLAAEHGNDLVENARLFALLNVALADAGIVAWDAKFAFNFCRPITAIRNAANDGNPDTEADPSWTPLIATPPFPSYTSGHSTFSAAAATVLAGFFGTDSLEFTATSEGTPGVTRSFSSLWAAAEEAGMSRIYGGIHYSFDNVDALNSGRSVGRYVLEHLPTPAPRHQGSEAAAASVARGPISHPSATTRGALSDSSAWARDDVGQRDDDLLR